MPKVEEKGPPRRDVRVASSALVSVLSKRFFKIVVIGFFFLFVVYVGFAATIMRFVPSTSGTGIQLVSNITHPGGFAEVGQRIMVKPGDPTDTSIGSQLERAFVPSSDYIMVDVVSEPYGEFSIVDSEGSFQDDSALYEAEGLTNDTGSLGSADVINDTAEVVIQYEGEDGRESINTEVSHANEVIESRDRMLLGEEYVVRCVSGACEEGFGYVVSHEDIVGGVVNISEIFSEDN